MIITDYCAILSQQEVFDMKDARKYKIMVATHQGKPRENIFQGQGKLRDFDFKSEKN